MQLRLASTQPASDSGLLGIAIAALRCRSWVAPFGVVGQIDLRTIDRHRRASLPVFPMEAQLQQLCFHK